MAGTFPHFEDAPDVLGADIAAVRRGVAEAEAVAAARQSDAARFIVENGHEVLGGHAPVGSPGDFGSDPDIYGPDASDDG